MILVSAFVVLMSIIIKFESVPPKVRIEFSPLGLINAINGH